MLILLSRNEQGISALDLQKHIFPSGSSSMKSTSGSPLRFMLRRSSLVECVSVLPGNRCLQNVEFFFLRQYVQPCLLKNPKYTFYTIKSSLKLA